MIGADPNQSETLLYNNPGTKFFQKSQDVTFEYTLTKDIGDLRAVVVRGIDHWSLDFFKFKNLNTMKTDTFRINHKVTTAVPTIYFLDLYQSK